MAGLGGRCIAIQLDGLAIVLQQRRLAGGKIVSQKKKKNCIVTAEVVGYRTVSQHRAATRPTRPRHGAGLAAGERARSGRARGMQEVGARARVRQASGRGTTGVGRWGARGAGAAAGAQGAGVAAGTRSARGNRRKGGRIARGTGAGCSTWARGLARAVHLVHSACFSPGLTQYCS